MLKTAFLNLMLRLLSSGSRLVLLIGLARFLPVEDVGRFGLVAVTIQLLVYGAGLEFHLFATRALLEQDDGRWPALLRSQLALHALAYAVLIPVLLLLFITGRLDLAVIGWLFPLFLVEHLCQELQRILITRSRPLLSNVVLFARTGAWALGILVAMSLWPATRDLRLVWAVWITGALAGIGIGFIGLRDLDWTAGIGTPIDREWIRRGLKISVPYFLGNLALVAITTVDRYLLAWLANEAAVGVYAFFFGITNAMVTLTESGVVNVVIADVIRGRRTGDPHAMKRLIHGVLVLVPAISVAIILFIKPLLAFVGKDLYLQNLMVCWVLLASVAVNTIGIIPNISLYAQRRDRPIVFSSFAGLIVAVIAHVVLIPMFAALGAALATLTAMLVVTGVKAIAILRPSSRAPSAISVLSQR